jgi:transcription elongation GreA/GreB family factor
MIVDDQNVFVISSQSPLGKLLIGKKGKDVVEMNGVKYTLHKII